MIANSYAGSRIVANGIKMTAVGFEPTQLALVELESTPLDHSGKLSSACCSDKSPHSLAKSAQRLRCMFMATGILA